MAEFALVVPLCLVLFAITIEGARTFWAYQTVISGVRDAARFVGRAAPSNICTEGGTLASYDTTLQDIVENTREGNTLFPASISVNSVTSSLTCITDDFRLSQTPIVTVQATLSIQYPFSSILQLVNIQQSSVTTVVTDSSRVFGA
ncbi:MAG: TadE/TadG family type IV pilus assembly protein [Roseovarius sp.]